MFDSAKLKDETLNLMKMLEIEPTVQMICRDSLTDDRLLKHSRDCMNLTNPATAESTWKRLDDYYKNSDPNGMVLLSLMLVSAVICKGRYKASAVPEKVFWDTMACFTRFLKEDLKNKGKVCFTRAFWVWRQLSCQLFRIGELEFEYLQFNKTGSHIDTISQDDRVLSVHIPSDANLDKSALKNSYEQAAAFARTYADLFFCQGLPKLFYCNTWLLSPELSQLLPERSGIRNFAEDYNLIDVNPDSDSFYEWLFDGQRNPLAMPTRSTLQRSVLKHLQNGGKIGAAAGWRKLNS